MIAKAALAILGAVLLATPALAQSGDSYTDGYNAGYGDAPPLGGIPDATTQYGQGYQDGQDDADDEDYEFMERQRAAEDEQRQQDQDADPTTILPGTDH